MTQPSEAAKRKACELANAAVPRNNTPWEPAYVGDTRFGAITALARYIQQTSDVAKGLLTAPYLGPERRAALQSLILPDDPDPLDKFAKWLNGCSKDGRKLQEAAAMFGLKIVQSDD